jgi:membrane-anchored protein YejM (alkaline phosphatase superfamily)
VSDATYPNNLFRLLAPDYDITVREVLTRFCMSPEYHCPDGERVRQWNYEMRAIGEFYLQCIAPRSIMPRLQANGLREQQQRFREFLGAIAPLPAGSKPALTFMHYMLPHSPYMLTPDGALNLITPNNFFVSAGDSTVLQRLRHDYERQIEFVDREVGEFIARVKQAGLYDPSLIVVTADHGVSWKNNAPGRDLTDATADMIFPVPLFIKRPGQRQGGVSSADAQLIDLVPTVAAVAGVRVPWPVSGRDLFGAAGPPREKVMIDRYGKKFAYPPDFAAALPGPSQ